ncbi:MAG: hypothetical protein ABIW49_03910 [Knoellia sp.]
MSSYLYGALTRKRLDTKSGSVLAFGQAESDGDEIAALGDATKETVSHWQDTLVALVPAEVLAFHGVAMTLGTTTTGTGDDTTTVITSPTEMLYVYWGLIIASFVLYLAGSKNLSLINLARGLVAPAAFVLWTMIQPSTAFDALAWNPSTLLRVMIALGGAVLLGLLVKYLATLADSETA